MGVGCGRMEIIGGISYRGAICGGECRGFEEAIGAASGDG